MRPLRPVVLIALAWFVGVSGEAAVLRMFVTSATGNGNLGGWPEALGLTGLAAGDEICRTLAGNESLPNATSYVAWLSDASDDAFCRVAGFSGKKATNCGQGAVPVAGPWVRVDDQPFARDLASLTTGNNVLYPGFVDETGAKIPTSFTVHTGTAATGELIAADRTCGDWISSSPTTPPWSELGGAQLGGQSWTQAAIASCNGSARLYCFEPGSGDPLLPYEEPGALVFATSAARSGNLGGWPEASGQTGLAAGDQICRTLAATATLPLAASFVAWLSASQSSTSAPDRLPIDGPWKRIDGVEVSATKAGLSALDPNPILLEAPPDQSELGVHVGNQALTGTLVTGAFAPGADCDGWTDDSSASPGEYGFPIQSTGRWTENPSDVDCSSFYRIYCFGGVVLLHWDHFESGDLRRWLTGP